MSTQSLNELKKPFSDLAINPLDKDFQRNFVTWLNGNTTSERYKQQDVPSKLKFFNNVKKNLQTIINNIGNRGVGAGTRATDRSKELYRAGLQSLVDLVSRQERPLISLPAAVPRLPHDLSALYAQEAASAAPAPPVAPVAPVAPAALPSHSSKNPYDDDNYDYYVPDAIKFPKSEMRDKFGDKTDEYKALLHDHRELLRRHNGKFTDEVRDVHNAARTIEHNFNVPHNQRQFRTTGTLFGAGTPKWRRRDINSMILNHKGQRTAEKMLPYSEGRCAPWEHSGQGCFSGGKRKTRKRRRRRKRKTRKHRKKKRTRRRKPKKRHRRTRRK
ncbi:MAG: hypothetical protein V3S42_00510 [Candidatus Neomarinimicrobiota bacterium]